MMKKACPFRGFAECLLENCMAWSGFDCRMFSVSPMFMGGGIGNNASVSPAATFHAATTTKELFTQDGLQSAAVIAGQENKT